MAIANLTYDAKRNILFSSFPPTRLETEPQVTAMFDEVLAFWKANCGGKKAYFVIDYTGYSYNVALTDFYGACMKRVVNAAAITVVRCGGDQLQRAALRILAVKTHMPSQLYNTREDAIAVVLAIQSGRITLHSA